MPDKIYHTLVCMFVSHYVCSSGHCCLKERSLLESFLDINKDIMIT